MQILTVAILILVIFLTLSFFFYKKVIHVTSLFITLIFFLSVALSLSALFLPQLYKSGAELALKDAPFGVQLKNFDTTMTDIGKIPTSIIGSLGNLFGQNNQSAEYKSDLYNQFIDFSGGLIRIMVLIFSLIIMFISVYVRYAYSGVLESDKLARKVSELEKEVNSLKGINRA
ncbi:MAG: hypothetical protein ABIM99_00040 [Candidatus Dojkabacteria bacterium]